MKKTPLRKRSKNPIATLRRKAVLAFNSWIRERDKKKLKGRCYTCGSPNGAEAGHWKHNCNALKFDERAVHLQCTRCNRWLSGNLAIYTLRLVKEYGLQEVQKMERLSHKPVQLSKKDYEKIIEKYSN